MHEIGIISKLYIYIPKFHEFAFNRVEHVLMVII
jgi:hypothetical protein